MFQSTHPHGVRHTARAVIDAAREFQSTHPHGVRRTMREQNKFNAQVSIHAPARGATSANIDTGALRLFQSTHPHGVRLTQCAFIIV